MHFSDERPTPANEANTRSSERLVLLDEVNFKWFFSGMGLWVDMARLHSDPGYANHFLKLAEASESRALRSCAASLRSQSKLIPH